MEVCSVHPYAPFVPKGARRLIIGTMPPRRFCRLLDFRGKEAPNEGLRPGDVDFYYGSRDNAFWKLLSELTGVGLDFAGTGEAVRQRRDLLEKLGLGLTDVVEKCVHRGGRSGDRDLQILEFRPLAKLLAERESIDSLIFTGCFAKAQLRHVLAGEEYGKLPGRSRARRVLVGGRPYRVLVLYSPSPRALQGIGGSDPRGTRLAQYRAVLLNEEYSAVEGFRSARAE